MYNKCPCRGRTCLLDREHLIQRNILQNSGTILESGRQFIISFTDTDLSLSTIYFIHAWATSTLRTLTRAGHFTTKWDWLINGLLFFFYLLDHSFLGYQFLLKRRNNTSVRNRLASSAGISPDESGGGKIFSKPIRRLQPIERPAEESRNRLILLYTACYFRWSQSFIMTLHHATNFFGWN
jgi:hypothetical protein